MARPKRSEGRAWFNRFANRFGNPDRGCVYGEYQRSEHDTNRFANALQNSIKKLVLA
jgi:hypothetical protein